MENEKAGQFISAMFDILQAVKAESEYCCKLCGGVSEKELFIIVFVGKNESVKMSEIADSLNAPLSTLTSIVDKLVDNEYLMRYNWQEDRRVVKVALAKKGKKSYLTFMKQKNKNANKVLNQFTESEQDILISYLTKLSKSLDFKRET
jgi:DNA-binding MarR family transcriptional regulator